MTRENETAAASQFNQLKLPSPYYIILFSANHYINYTHPTTPRSVSHLTHSLSARLSRIRLRGFTVEL